MRKKGMQRYIDLEQSCNSHSAVPESHDLVYVRSATAEELPVLVDLHLAAFSGFFLSFLGSRFLLELYRGFLAEPAAVLLVASADSKPLGFVAGAAKPAKFFSRLLLRRWYAFVWAAIPALLRQPGRVAPKLLSALTYRGDLPPLRRAALLSSIAVAPEAAGKGVGKRLVEAFCARAAELGCGSVYLLTDRDDNPRVNSFYLSTGFTLEGQIKKDDQRWLNRYVRQCVPVQSGEIDHVD